MRKLLFLILFYPGLASALPGFEAYGDMTSDCNESWETACTSAVSGDGTYKGYAALNYYGNGSHRCMKQNASSGSVLNSTVAMRSCTLPDPPSCADKAGVSVWTNVDQAPLIKDGDDCLAECVLVVDNDPMTPAIRCSYTGTMAQVDENDNIIPPNGYPEETSPEHCEVDNNAGVCLDSNHPDNATNGDGSQAEGCPDTRPQYGTVARSGKSYNVCVASGGGGDGITFSQDPGAPVNTGGSGTPSPGNDSDSGSSGGGAAEPSTGNTGGGSNDPSTWGDLGENDYYEPGQTGTGQELTYSNILTNFQFRVAESTVGSSWKNFFSASLTGACPTYSVSTWIFSITFDQWCSAMMPWGLIGGVIMACALFMGGRIAFT